MKLPITSRNGTPASPLTLPLTSRRRFLSQAAVAALLATPLAAFGRSGSAPVMAQGTPEAELAPAATWQATGDPANPLLAPSGAAIDAEGNIWVVDAGHDQVQIIGPDGQFVESWDGTSGGGKAFDFHKASGGADGDIAFAPDGRIYVAETGGPGHRVQIFDRDRQWLATWGTFGPGDGKFLEPISVAVDTDGNVYVADNQQRRIQKFSPEGTFLQAFGGADSVAGVLQDTGNFTVDRQGNVVMPVWGFDHIIVFAPDGSRRAEWGSTGSEPGQFRTPSDVVIDVMGNIFVSDLNNTRIQVLDPNGQPLAAWGTGTTPSGQPNPPYSMALDAEGNLYVVGTALDSESEANVQKFRIVPSLVPVTMGTPQP
ncbi:MAG: NHL repeat-containing protein [Thermomicrobiales bacterium]